MIDPTLAHSMAAMAPPGSEVHQIIAANPLPVVDPLSPELRRAFDRVFLQNRDSERLRNPFPGESL